MYIYIHICVYIYVCVCVSKISATHIDMMWSHPLVNRQPPVAIQPLPPCSLISNSYHLPVVSQLAVGPQERLTMGLPFLYTPFILVNTFSVPWFPRLPTHTFNAPFPQMAHFCLLPSACAPS